MQGRSEIFSNGHVEDRLKIHNGSGGYFDCVGHDCSWLDRQIDKETFFMS